MELLMGWDGRTWGFSNGALTPIAEMPNCDLFNIGRKVKLVIYGAPPVYGKITKIIHESGPAWPAFYEINFGTDEKPELACHYEYGNGYELDYAESESYDP